MEGLEGGDSMNGDDDVVEVPRDVRVLGSDESETQLPRKKRR